MSARTQPFRLPAPAVSYLCHQAKGPFVGSLAKYNNPLIPRAIYAGSSRSPRGRANRRDLHVPSCLVTTVRHPCAQPPAPRVPWVLELLIAADLERLPEDVVTPRVLVKVLDRLRDEIAKAKGSGDYGTVERLASGLREGIDDVTLYWQVMDQVRSNIDQKRKLVDTHVRQLAREHGPVNWYDVAMIMEEMRRDVRVIIDEFIDDPVKRSQAIKMLQSQTRPGPGPHLA